MMSEQPENTAPADDDGALEDAAAGNENVKDDPFTGGVPVEDGEEG